MGLAERRAAKEFEETIYPGLKKAIDAAAGFEIPVEVRWDTLAKDENGKYATSWSSSWPKIYFQPIVDAFKKICADDMGRDALKAALKKIVVQDTTQSYSSYWANFDSGTLTLDYQFCNVDDVNSRTDVLQKTLEKVL